MPALALIDWLVILGYGLVVAAIGVVVARRHRGEDGDGFFLAGGRMPVLPVAISVLATSLSAATFVGGPQQAYAGDMTYLAGQLGGLLGAVVVAALFLPAFARLGVTSVYELLGHRFGPGAQRFASVCFLLGRVLASGTRLFIVSLAVALVLFGTTSPTAQLAAIVLVALVATAYTVAGGIRAVIWTDMLQAGLLVFSVGLGLVLLWRAIGMPAGDVVGLLRADGKLRTLQTSFALDQTYALPAVVIGLTLFNMAALGTDQDLTQRLLTCRRARDGAKAVILSQLIAWPIVALFLVIGLLLYVRAQTDGSPPAVDTRWVFLEFIVTDVPAGARGLMVAGLLAAAMSSTDSALNAMASAFVADLYRPWRARRGRTPEAAHERRVSRGAVAVGAIALAGFASICIIWQERSGQTLIDFALGVMVFAYGGLAGVFLAALTTRRGNDVSAVAGCAAGIFVVIVLANPFGATAFVAPDVAEWAQGVAFPWRMVLATAVSFGVTVLGRRRD